MSGRRRQTLSPSLFPFLAVLVCTLGTLILLLALVAENSTDAAVAAAQEESQPEERTQEDRPKLTLGQVKDLIEEEQFRVEELVAMRDEQTGDLENRRDQLAHLDDHIRRIRLQLKHISEQMIATMDKDGVEEVDEKKLAELQERIEQNKAELEKLREKTNDKTPRVVIVPHKGPNGTDRRPIYLECDADGVTIWPEGSKIELTALKETTRGANPLDAALRVARFRALQDYGDSVAPYPMLIVRPDGVPSYSAARTAMRDWDDQFGYELVPEEVDLAYSKPDIELKNRMEDAIRQAVIKQYGFQAIASRAGRGSGGSFAGASRRRPGESGAGSGGDSESRQKPLPRLSAAQMDRQGRSNGYEDHRVPVGSRFSGSYGSGASNSAGTGEDVAAKLDERLREAASELAADGGLPAGDSFPGASQSLPGLGNANGSTPGTALDELGQQSLAQGTNNGLSMPASDPSELRPGGKYQQNPYASPGATDLSSNSESSPDKDRIASASPTQLTLNAPSGNPPGGASTSGTAGTAQLSQNQPVPPPSANASAAGASTRTSQSSLDNPAEMRDAELANRTPPSSASAGTSAPSKQPSSSNVRRGGMDWALPPEVARSRGNAIVRSIRVECYQDSFVLLPSSRSRDRARSFSFTDGEVNRATLELATAIRDRISSWGAAIPGGRWQPRLDVTVMERGDHRFHQLRTLMTGSGVEIQRSDAR